MTGRPDALIKLDGLIAASTIAHEAVFDLHRALTSAGRDDDRTRELLAESARIALQELPNLTVAARGLQERWHEQSVLDPGRVSETLEDLREELGRVEPAVQRLLGRQKTIARQLQALVER